MNKVRKPWSDGLARVMILMRDLKGLGLREHARQLGMNPATLHRIEKGKGCDLDTLVFIHQKTGVKYDILLGGGSVPNGRED